MSKIDEKIKKFIENINKVPEDFFQKTPTGRYEVIWLLDRQRPSVESSYDFDEERIGITKEGGIIWGFDSGCSCPSPWSAEDYGDTYSTTKTWKEFKMNIKTYEGNEEYHCFTKDEFDRDWSKESEESLDELLLIFKKKITIKEALSVRNSELRRYLIKRIGYDKLRQETNVTIIVTEEEYEIIDVNIGRSDERFSDSRPIIDRYLKVVDSSTDRIFLLGIPNHIKDCKQAVAWTFGLSKEQYNPIKET